MSGLACTFWLCLRCTFLCCAFHVCSSLLWYPMTCLCMLFDARSWVRSSSCVCVSLLYVCVYVCAPTSGEGLMLIRSVVVGGLLCPRSLLLICQTRSCASVVVDIPPLTHIISPLLRSVFVHFLVNFPYASLLVVSTAFPLASISFALSGRIFALIPLLAGVCAACTMYLRSDS